MYFFGQNVEIIFKNYFGEMLGSIHFLILYFLGMILASAYTYFKHQNDFSYRALGASGAVSAALFASIVLMPNSSVMIFPLPIPIPAIVFGPLYLAYSVYMSKKGTDNVGHDAHFYGAIFGIVYTLAINPSFGARFLDAVKSFIS